ncbi:hypothetical protein Hdeb2414_s0001g00036891 [Helianthus debilis subsp. tardiflorus]
MTILEKAKRVVPQDMHKIHLLKLGLCIVFLLGKSTGNYSNNGDSCGGVEA